MPWLDRFFRQAELAADVKQTLGDLASQGQVVFVMRSAGWLNLSFIRWLVRHLGLPPLAAAIGMGRRARLLLGRRGGAKALNAAVGARAPALIFLRRPSVWRAKGVGAPIDGEEDPFSALVERQGSLGRPIFLVPILYVWSRRPQRIKPSLIDIVLGSTEAPGALATSLGFLRNFRRAFVRMGAPVDLRAFLEAEARKGGAALIPRKLRGVLYYHLTRQARTVLGPPFKEPARVRDEVMRDRQLQETIAWLARDSRRPPDDVARDARRIVREIAARMSPTVFEIVRPFVRWLCARLYQEIELDEAGLGEVRQAANRGALVLCPSHKSHMDYVMLSYLFYENGLLPPHIAAGINLAFWPVGALARWTGGYFIRRSFKGDQLYGAVLRAYVRRLIRDGFPQEFFIEGRRSRSGKLGLPRTGLLSMEVDAGRDSAIEDVFFVPVAIDYEQLAEGSSYASELRGGQKRKESLWALLRARKALRARQGRIYVQFSQPISLKALSAAAVASAPAGSGPTAAHDVDDEATRRAFVHRLANRIAYGINRASTITPVGLCAVALLAEPGPIPGARIAARVALLRELAARDGGRLSSRLRGGANTAADPIAEALALLARDGLVQPRTVAGAPAADYVVPAQRRAELDFYRNNVIHHFIAYAIVAAAMCARRLAGAGVDEGGRADVERDARWLSRLLKLEFIFRVGTPFEAIFAETVAAMDRAGLAALAGGGRGGASSAGRPEEPVSIAFLAQMVRPFLDGYRAAAVTLTTWRGGDERSFAAAALESAREAAAAGEALPEAVSRATVDNAAAWLTAEGALEPAPGPMSDRWQVAPAWRAGRTRALIVEMDRFRVPSTADV